MEHDAVGLDTRIAWNMSSVELEEAPRTKYRVELFDTTNEDTSIELGMATMKFTTHGVYEIQGDFIVIWDEAYVRQAHRIPPNVDFIKCTEIVEKVKEEEDEQSLLGSEA